MNIYDNRFNISIFIEQCQDKDYLDIIAFSEKEYQNSSKIIKGVDAFIDTYRSKYNDFVHEFLFFLQSGTKPAGMSDIDFQLTKPIIQRLVEKGQF